MSERTAQHAKKYVTPRKATPMVLVDLPHEYRKKGRDGHKGYPHTCRCGSRQMAVSCSITTDLCSSLFNFATCTTHHAPRKPREKKRQRESERWPDKTQGSTLFSTSHLVRLKRISITPRYTAQVSLSPRRTRATTTLHKRRLTDKRTHTTSRTSSLQRERTEKVNSYTVSFQHCRCPHSQGTHGAHASSF